MSRVAIRSFESEDVTGEYVGWLNDRELMKYSRQRFWEHTRESCEKYVQSFALGPNRFWGVVRCDDGALVGTATAYVDEVNDVADVGLMIGLPGRGYGRRAFGTVLAHLFGGEKVHKVTAGTLSANLAMQRIALCWGMRHEGTRRGQERFENGYGDVLLFGILMSEWLGYEHR